MGERKQKKKRNREFDDRHHQQTFSFLLVSRDYWFYYDDHSVRRITITNLNNDDGCHIQNDNVLWTMMTTTHTLTLKPNNNQTITFSTVHTDSIINNDEKSVGGWAISVWIFD